MKEPQPVVFPPLYRVTQHFGARPIQDVGAAVRAQFDAFDCGTAVRAGQTAAVAVGSRGTHDLVTLVRTVIECLRRMGLEPFVIPAMGSHGGANGKGQARVLAELGISEQALGVPVVAGMEVASLGRLETGAEVYFAEDALKADHIVVINRVKPHTAFRGEVESGLCKILAVGCGRQKGASEMHRYGLARSIVPAAAVILEKSPVLCGLAVTETASGGTHSIRLARPEEFAEVDRALLKEAWELLPRLPVDDLDVLLVDEMGKNISGAGMDPNVIGFWRREGGPREPDYRTVVVLDLTPESHGNATGIGMADLTTRRMLEQIDQQATAMNALTSGVLRSARLPLAVENDCEAVRIAVQGVADPARLRMARIVNTASLGTFWVTASVHRELALREDLAVDETPLSLEFSESGRLLPMRVPTG